MSDLLLDTSALIALEAGDAAAITALEQVEITASENAELLLFDLA